MKRPGTIGLCSLFIALMTFSTPVIAEDKSGLFGTIRLGGGVVNTRPSGLEVLNDNEKRDSLEGKANRRSQGLLLLSADIGYIFDESGATLMAAINTEGSISLALRHEIVGVGELTYSALYEKKEVWKNPYLVGANRNRTDAESLGVAMDWERILGSGARLALKHQQIDIADDLIGQAEPGLRRDGADTTLGIGYCWDLDAGGVVSTDLSYVWIDRDGAGNRGYAYLVEVTHELNVDRLTFSTYVELKNTYFDGVHPVFNKKRNESAYRFSEMITFAAPFGYTNWSVFGVASIGATAANIDFFDSSTLFSGAGIGYRF
ncbi:MAG TPA: DUF2860 family protein [Pelovirga sp.]|nr:DUF2860 family protein [Pelovirga sp.]